LGALEGGLANSLDLDRRCLDESFQQFSEPRDADSEKL